MVSQTQTSTDYQALARHLKILADPRRLQILDLLLEGVQCNCEIGNHLDMAPNLISHHLGVLRKSGLVIAERDPVDARWIYYSVNPTELERIGALIGHVFDTSRIKPRRPDCGPASVRLHTG